MVVAFCTMNWHEYFTYDPETGNLIWKERPTEHFPRLQDHATWNTRFAGKVAGVQSYDRVKDRRSCIHLRVKFHGKPQIAIGAHRVIWEMHYGPVPKGMLIDHADCDSWNNRLANLRPATPSQNAQNCRPRVRSSSSGVKGVHWFKKTGKWRVTLHMNGKMRSFGLYSNLEDAKEAYRKAATENFGEFARFDAPDYWEPAQRDTQDV